MATCKKSFAPRYTPVLSSCRQIIYIYMPVHPRYTISKIKFFFRIYIYPGTPPGTLFSKSYIYICRYTPGTFPKELPTYH